MDSDAHVNHLLQTFGRWPVVFGTDEILNFAPTDIDGATALHAIADDARFISLHDHGADEQTYLTRATIFRFFFLLNCRLARAQVVRLREAQLLGLMSTLQPRTRWDRVPRPILDFAAELGLILPSFTSGHYAFPVARAIAGVGPVRLRTFERSVDELWSCVSQRGRSLGAVRDGLLRTGFSQFDKRTARVVQTREGLIGTRKRTLEQIGARYHVTRERIRQIEFRFWDKVKRVGSLAQPFLFAFLYDVMSRPGNLLVSELRPDVMRVRFLAKCAGSGYEMIPFTRLMLLGGLPNQLHELTHGRRAREVHADEVARALENDEGMCLASGDVHELARLLARPAPTRLTLARMVYLTLRGIGRPAHFSEVTDAFRRTFPHRKVRVRNIHAVLGRAQHGVVWIGLKGTFALREWGFGRPPKGMFELATQIVEETFARTGQPVPFSTIAAEFPKYRPVFRRSSLTMAVYFNRKLQRMSGNRFLPRQSQDRSDFVATDSALDGTLLRLESSKGTRAQGD